MTAPLIFLAAGEPSGDALGARLMAALDRLSDGRVRFAGVGGPRMAAEGLESLFPMADLAVMGAAEVLPRAPLLMRRIRETVDAIGRLTPAAVVTIDSPGFAFRVQRRLPRGKARRIHFVAPSVWAWRPGRARTIAEFLDRVLCLLPFEPPYFEREGLAASFVGHPVVEEGADKGDGAAFRARHALGGAPVLAVLPGSRRSETSRLLPIFGRTVAALSATRPDLRVVVPTVSTVVAPVRAAVSSWSGRPIVLEGTAEKFDAFAAARAALAASGTVSLELALAGLPMAIAYKINPVTYAWVKPLIKLKHVTLANILLEREAVPEFLQARCRSDLLADAVARLLDDETVRQAQLRDLREAVRRLGAEGEAPSVRAARAVLDEMGKAGG
jgi:lipid-A-disaccharide synthase